MNICVHAALSLSCVWLFVTLWTAPHQASLSMEYSRQETRVGCHFLLQRIFLTQRLNPHFLHWQVDSNSFSSSLGSLSMIGTSVLATDVQIGVQMMVVCSMSWYKSEWLGVTLSFYGPWGLEGIPSVLTLLEQHFVELWKKGHWRCLTTQELWPLQTLLRWSKS